ncbi:MAG TPA: AI-2E family transporter [Phycisphaerae bacterium]|nr:AI-2E family transporter [Phycisphaerae bacterium]
MTDADRQPSVPRAGTIVATFAVLVVLYLARDVLIPFALAIFLAFLLAPPIRRLQRWGIPRIPAVFAVVAFTVSLLTVGSLFVGSRAMSLVEQLPKYRHNIIVKARALRESIGGTLQPVSQTVDEIAREIAGPPPKKNESARPNENGLVGPEQLPTTPQTADVSEKEPASAAPAPVTPVAAIIRLLRTMLVPLLHPVVMFALAAVFTLFFLVYREDLRDRIIEVCGDGRIGATTTAFSDVGERISRYFDGLVLTNILNGIAIGVGLALIGIPDAILFAVLAAVLRFVPFLGTWIAALLPIAYALAIEQGWTIPLLVAGLFVVVDQLSANLLEPWLYGSRVGASPTAIILSMVVWTWLWGAFGLLLATPITVFLVVLGKYVPQFQKLYILLGDQPALQPPLRIYQRVLAMEEKEAVKIVELAAKDSTPEAAFSHVLVPALHLLADDDNDASLGPVRRDLTRRAVDDLIERLTPRVPNRAADADAALPPARDTQVFLIPAPGPYDEIAAPLLARLFEAAGGWISVASSHLLVAELLKRIEADQPKVVCLVTVHARNIAWIEPLCRRITEAKPDITLVVGVWDPRCNAARLSRRFSRFRRVRCSAHFAATLAELRSTIHRSPGAVPPEPAAPRSGLWAGLRRRVQRGPSAPGKVVSSH